MKSHIKLGVWLVIVLAFTSGTVVWGQLGTSFTYQGSLLENGTPANGIYDLTFTLYDRPTGGVPAGQSVSVQNISINKGIFSVELDFGGGPFDNNDRWLQIAVDGTTLTPRQPLTGAPYSIQTRGVQVNSDASFVGIGMSGSHLTVTDNGRVGIGTTIPGAQLHVESNITAFKATASDGPAIVGITHDPFEVGIYGQNTVGGVAGLFNGDVQVFGNLSKSSGSFKIDHPLDPENKFLFHSYVESPDMMNVYNGNVVTNEDGFATIEMPEWFERLNREFRYQLTVIDGANSEDFVFAKVVQEMHDNQFRIRTSAPETKVSWQVTGVRQDAWAEAHRIQVEVDKVGHEIGHYLHPEVYGHDRDMSIEAARQALVNAALVNATDEVGSLEAAPKMEDQR